DSLRILAQRNRTLGTRNRDGIIPGEGAGFALLLREGSAARGSALQILGVALGAEKNHFCQDRPNLAEGLTQVFRLLRTQRDLGSRITSAVLSCQTGESFWADEFAKAYLRNLELMPEPLVIHVVASSVGDVGAAAGIIQQRMAEHCGVERNHCAGA